ncbi:laccase [Suillus subalutaceus]|uniref:laccase n=1 Tax=Suillus subalutaceus TaxID=48586 RepID=UPI001B86FF2D|nr:laccase [Suillus subalutaceus]KAG1849287.1 laccase [Suillus subalutaceus]
MFQLYVFLFFLASLQSHAVTIGPVSDLVVANCDVSPDGFTRSAVLAGGTNPGPTIVAQKVASALHAQLFVDLMCIKGDTFKINVTNQLSNESMLTSTSIHWHGLAQQHSNQMDGTAFVTQCPIAPGHSFLYEFNAGNQVGTYWYHSHYGDQYCDGLRGPLIIYDPHDPYRSLYDIDDESTIITLTDWYNVPSPQVHEPALPDSVLINNVGRYDGGPDVPFAVIDVQPRKRYRFRLLSMACKPNYIFSIDGHNLTIIEVDGHYVKPLIVDSIQIYTGQRYSFILETDQTVDNYWVHANPDLGTNATAILRYAGSPNADPKNRTTLNSVALNETNLHPLSPVSSRLLGEPDVKLDLVLGSNKTTFTFSINGVQYTPPSVPVLLQILSGAMTAADLAPNGTVYVLPRNKVIEITFNTNISSGDPHPFHLHGHSFIVVRSAGSSGYNYVDPVTRDTVSAGNLGNYATIRFITDNPGPWFLHCHINWHISEGLAIVFAEAPEDVAASQPVNDAWKQLCPIFNSLPQQSFTSR